MKKVTRAVRWGALGVLALATVGCGNKVKTYEIEGTLLYDGRPVPAVDVTFAGADGSRGGSALTNAEGKFKMRFARGVEGIPKGTYKVCVSSKGEMAPSEERDSLPDIDAALERYSFKNTPLTYQVEKTDKDVKFELSLE
ncbi:MAG: carboxypeptidase regulatory-like domain-containing protein [Thermoguttaceae bacterium]|nr:carboxypeptidase regulatory-like domain-containing protein [Thermoguttaceae bacterium]